MGERCSHEVRVITVKWIKPPTSLFKLNTDGSALSNPGKIGGGVILRDWQGNMIFAFSIPLGIGTNNEVETHAATYGVNWCIQHGYRKISQKYDSELLTKWLNSTAQTPWKIQHHLQELQDRIRQLDDFQCNHTYREANCTSDFLAKWSHKFDIPQHYYVYQQLPMGAKGSYLLEKLGMTNFRRRNLKKIKKPP